MTRREQLLTASAAGVPILLGLVYLAYLHLFTLAEYDQKIEDLAGKVHDKDLEARKIVQGRPQMERWRYLSLPADRDLAQREYYRYLEELLRGSGFEERELHPLTPIVVKGSGTNPQNKPIFYTALPFDARGKATLANLVQMLERFQRLPVDHKIKKLSVTRVELPTVVAAPPPGAPAGAVPGAAPAGAPGAAPAGPPGRPPGGFPGRPFGGGAGGFGKNRGELLTVQLVVEAIIVEGANKQQPNLTGLDHRLVELDVLTGLRRGPLGLALLPWAAGPRGPGGQRPTLASTRRTYTDIARKNIFIGAPGKAGASKKGGGLGGFGEDDDDEIDVTPWIYVTEITLSDMKQEAQLFNRLTNRTTRLRLATGYNTFVIQSEQGETTVLRGKVVRIEPRDVYIAANDAVYGLHIGASLQDALRRPLPQKEVQALGLQTGSSP